MKKEIIELEVKTGDSIQNVKALDNSVKDVTKSTKDVDAANKELGSGLDRMSGGAIGAFKGMLASVKAVTGGFNIMKIAIIGTGIGALIIAILAVKAAFTNTEEGQNKFAKIMGVIGSVTGNLVDILASLGDKLIWVFENPKKAINDFVKLLKENIINRFEGLLELVPALGKAINQLFKGDFSGAAETAANAVAKVTLGTNNLSASVRGAAEALKKMAAEIASDAKEAAKIADKRAQADKIDRDLIVQRAAADQKIAELRFKTEQTELFTIAERIKFLKEADAIETATTNREIAANKLRLDAQIAENKLSGSNKDALDAVAQLKAKGIELDTAKLRLQKRLITGITSLQNEEKAGIKVITDAKQKALDDQKIIDDKTLSDIAALKNKIFEAQRTLDADNDIKKLELEQKREQEDLNKLKTTAANKQELQLALDILHFDQRESARIERENKAREKLAEDLQKKSESDLFTFDERLAAEVERTRVLLTNTNLTETERTRIEKEGADARIKIADLETKAKQDALDSYAQALSTISGLLGKETTAGKALAVAAALISTYLSAQKAYESQLLIATPDAPIRAALAAGVAVASGLATVKAILKVKTPGSVSAPSLGSGGVSAPQAQAPSFNIVGSSGTNQLASAIGDQTQAPIRAFVVSTDVSTAASMDRNIVRAASLG